MTYRGPWLSCCFIIWLLPRPPPLRKRNNVLTEEGGGEEAKSRRRESLVLYKSFNTLWCHPSAPSTSPAHEITTICFQTNILSAGKTRSHRRQISVQKHTVERGGSGRSNTSPLTPIYFPVNPWILWIFPLKTT
jgi:hypothetical protein